MDNMMPCEKFSKGTKDSYRAFELVSTTDSTNSFFYQMSKRGIHESHPEFFGPNFRSEQIIRNFKKNVCVCAQTKKI